ncbi:MAG: hypothetical protein IT332_13160 [Ardenticatenales bacterium]|nr:hypothetical protein [Ardenticatenales bacterium]
MSRFVSSLVRVRWIALLAVVFALPSTAAATGDAPLATWVVAGMVGPEVDGLPSAGAYGNPIDVELRADTDGDGVYETLQDTATVAPNGSYQMTSTYGFTGPVALFEGTPMPYRVRAHCWTHQGRTKCIYY